LKKFRKIYNRKLFKASFPEVFMMDEYFLIKKDFSRIALENRSAYHRFIRKYLSIVGSMALSNKI